MTDEPYTAVPVSPGVREHVQWYRTRFPGALWWQVLAYVRVHLPEVSADEVRSAIAELPINNSNEKE